MHTAFAQKQLEMFKDTVSSTLTESQLITTAGEKNKKNKTDKQKNKTVSYTYATNRRLD